MKSIAAVQASGANPCRVVSLQCLAPHARGFRGVVSIDSQVNARLLPLADYVKTQEKESSVMRLAAMIWLMFVLVSAFLVGVKFAAELIKTRPRKCNVFHHLGVPTAATPNQSDTNAD